MKNGKTVTYSLSLSTRYARLGLNIFNIFFKKF